MRRLGILGGMGWPSTAESYRLLNEEITRRLGGQHTADLVLRSFDFATVQAYKSDDDWEGAGAMLADAAVGLCRAGAEGIVLATNTMHRCAAAIEAAVDVPFLHIADATARALTRDDVSRVGLLGTRFTMEGDAISGRLAQHGVTVVVPEAEDRDLVHRVIYDELVHGVIREASRDALLGVVDRLLEDEVDGVIAGCTAIELLLGPDDVPTAWYPTTALQVTDAVDWMLAEDR